MKSPQLFVVASLAVLAASGCSRPTEMASNASGKGKITVAAAAPNSPPPELPPEVIAEREGELPAPDASPTTDPAAPDGSVSGPATVEAYRASVAGNIAALPPVGDAPALAAAFVSWKERADSSPGAFEQGQVQLGADAQEYRPSDAELVAAEAGDRLSAALQGADEATKASVVAMLSGVRSYRRFDYRRVDVAGSGRFVYASAPRETQLPL